MTKYRFKTEIEFKADGDWDYSYNAPLNWNDDGKMNHLFGEDIPDMHNKAIESGCGFSYKSWSIEANECIIKKEEQVMNF